MPKKSRDIEKVYTAKQFVSKLRRLADAIENDQRFRIQVAGERVSVPPDAMISVEHERAGDEEEVEFQISSSGQNHDQTMRGCFSSLSPGKLHAGRRDAL
ncbi:MAG: amphi-Trp domain-containing protein [Thioalkalivibrio sp.]|nr:amphi-Trp domain-containing protein [Thioalkalivibrio sp.]